MKRDISGVILCGGRSSRMGRPKALLPWHGMHLITHMVNQMRRVFDDIVVVSNDGLELPELQARVVVDRTANLGPLGGIREALHAIHCSVALITSTDAPYFDAALVDSLTAAGRTAAFEVDGWIEPFPALYARELCTTADTLLDQGRRRPLHLLQKSGFERLDGSEWSARGAFKNFNTPEEYLHAVTAVDSTATVTVTFSGTKDGAVGEQPIDCAIGTLRDVLQTLAVRVPLLAEDRIAPGVQIFLEETQPLDDLNMPLGPGESLRVVMPSAKGTQP